MAFKFKFDSILNLKTRLEDMKKAEFKKASEKLEEEKEELKRVLQLREAQYTSMAEREKKGFTVKEVISFNSYITTLKKRIELQRKRVIESSNKLEELRQALIKVSKEKKMFEILKEKKMEEYLKDYYKKEQQNTDDIVNFRYKEGAENG